MLNALLIILFVGWLVPKRKRKKRRPDAVDMYCLLSEIFDE